MSSAVQKSPRLPKTFYKKKKQLSPPKYKNTYVSSLCSYGFSHRSKLEASVCQLIWLREKAGEIKHLQHEVHVHMTFARIEYVADFECLDLKTNQTFFVEAKGFESPTWPIKKRLYRYYGPKKLEIWKGRYERPVLDEIIVPSA